MSYTIKFIGVRTFREIERKTLDGAVAWIEKNVDQVVEDLTLTLPNGIRFSLGVQNAAESIREKVALLDAKATEVKAVRHALFVGAQHPFESDARSACEKVAKRLASEFDLCPKIRAILGRQYNGQTL